MRSQPGLRIIILGRSVTSSWGHGHATTYRALMCALAARGHDVLFLERDDEGHAAHRDLLEPPYGRTVLYTSLSDLDARCAPEVRLADCVIVGSSVPEGIGVGEWVLETARGVRAFYDLDTPATLAAFAQGEAVYISREQVARYDLYLACGDGPALTVLERECGSPCARPLFCAFDPATHYPECASVRWDLGYMGAYHAPRQPVFERLLVEAAARLPRARFAVAGSGYPAQPSWPGNVTRVGHVPPGGHRAFYASQRFSLHMTGAEASRTGYAPHVRLFEAAACGTPIISDYWDGLDACFVPGREILVAETTEDVLRHLRDVTETGRRLIGARARTRVLGAHTPAHRVAQLEGYVTEALGLRRQLQAS